MLKALRSLTPLTGRITLLQRPRSQAGDSLLQLMRAQSDRHPAPSASAGKVATVAPTFEQSDDIRGAHSFGSGLSQRTSS
jgi:hypothetical protein